MLKRVIKLGAIALLLLGVSVCATHAIEKNYTAVRIRHNDELKDTDKNGVEPAGYYDELYSNVVI